MDNRKFRLHIHMKPATNMHMRNDRPLKELKKRRVQMVFTETEYDLLRLASRHNGLSFSGFMLMAATQRAVEDLTAKAKR